MSWHVERFLLTLCTAAFLVSCGESAVHQGPMAASTATASVKALPFTVDTVMLSDLFQGGLKVSKVNVRVTDGSTDEWIATAIAIADAVAKLGADSIEVTVDRSDLQGIEAPPMYQHLAKVMYSPNPQRTVWEGDKQLLVMVTPQPATRQEVQRDNDYWTEVQRLVQHGVDENQADKRAGVLIAKKYGLPANWELFSGGLHEKEFTGAEFNVDSSEARKSLAVLEACMRGKIIRLLTPCSP